MKLVDEYTLFSAFQRKGTVPPRVVGMSKLSVQEKVLWFGNSVELQKL
jgi:hypothetical protein